MSSVKPFIYGGLASITAEFGTFPIDTTKTRLQVQGQVADEALRAVRYRGMLHALYVISREEGITALYNGIAPAILRQASYGTMKIGLYHFFKKRISVTLQRGESLYTNIGAGILSGAIGSSLANPTDVLKVRMQVGSLKEYEARQGMLKSFSRIYHTEGLKGLYRGVVPTAQRAAVIAGVLLPSYDFFKQSLLDYGVMGDTVTTHFVAGFLAGILGTAASNPVDVVKSRMMNQAVLLKNTSAMAGHVYTGSTNCFVMTLRTEGVTALYKGFIPSYLRIGPWNIIVSLHTC